MFGQKKDKSSKNMEQDAVEIAQCPVCKSVTTLLYYMQNSDTKKRSKWYSCSCGVVWQTDEPSGKYDRKYYERYKDGGKKYEEACKYPVYVYAPIIEELVYSRKMLQIGMNTPYQAEAFRERGWVTYSIDKNKDFKDSERLIVGDFEERVFGTSDKYDVVWAYHTIECFSKPIESLSKCLDLLSEGGILFIATPDTDFINTRSSGGFIHWQPEYNRIMWNIRSLSSALERLGFDIVLARRNYEARFPAQDDLHLIAQKRYF